MRVEVIKKVHFRDRAEEMLQMADSFNIDASYEITERWFVVKFFYDKINENKKWSNLYKAMKKKFA